LKPPDNLSFRDRRHGVADDSGPANKRVVR